MLSTKEVAKILKVNVASIVNWEKAHTTPQLYQIKELCEAIKFTGTDEELLQVFALGEAVEALDQSERPASLQPCQTETTRDILESSGPPSFVVQGPVRGFSFMDALRRQFIEWLARFSGASVFGDVSLAIVSSPTVEPEEYLSLVGASMGTWWQWLNQGNYHKLERVLSKNVPILARLANTIFPFQRMAASLAVEAKIMQIFLANRNLQFREREGYCVEAVQFAALSGDRNLHALALYRYGDTYTYCCQQPQTAIRYLNDALSSLDGNALIRSAIYSGLSMAHAQDKDETNAKENERLAFDYAEMARQVMPSFPNIDPLYECLHGPSELDQFEGKSYLYLAENFSKSSYARKAYDVFNESTNKQSASKGFFVQALIRKADAARALGDIDEFAKCLTKGLLKANNFSSSGRISESLVEWDLIRYKICIYHTLITTL